MTPDEQQQQEEDPFSCFGSSDSDSDDEGETEEQEECHRQRRVDQVNLRNSIAQQAVDFLPIENKDRYEVVTIPLKGQGVVARQTFSTGDEILRESPVMRVPNHQAASSLEEAQDQHRRAIQQAYDRLHPNTQKAVLELSCAEECRGVSSSSRLHQVYQTNSYQLTGQDEAMGGLFLTVARMNHSCCPNAGHFWREDLQAYLVLATREILPGDEICTTYGFPSWIDPVAGFAFDTAGRRSYLQDRFSFVCQCTLCEQGNAGGGDDRMKELHALQDDIPVLMAEGKSRDAIAAIDRCRQILQQQGFGRTTGAFVKSLLHQGYQVASDSSGDFQDMDLARSYLSEELVAVEHGEGIGSPNALQIRHMLDAMA